MALSYTSVDRLYSQLPIIRNVLARRVFTQERMKESTWPQVFKEALGQLEEIAKGSIQLVGSDGTLVPTLSGNREMWSNTKDYHPTFVDGLSDLDQFHDPDKIDDLEDDKDL